MAYVLDDDVSSSSSCIEKKDDDSSIDHDSTVNSNHGDADKNSINIRITRRRLLIGYLVAYNILGIILHPNFYPWT